MSADRTPPSIEARVRRLEDREAIAHILNDYCRALDLMDLPAIRALFTEDCLVSYGPAASMESRGAEAVSNALRRLWRWSRTSHHLSNIQVTFETDNRARAVSYVIAWHERPNGSTGTLWGQYHDVVVRTAAGWRIAERRQVMNGNDAGFDVGIHRLARRPPPE
jgi:ketosteroid isomerase-like protein